MSRTHVPQASLTPDLAYVATATSDPFQILSAEHALLRRDFARLVGALPDAGDMPEDPRVLASLSDSLERHLDIEELVIYPVCERLFGGTKGAAAVVRADHAALRGRIAALLADAGTGGCLSRMGVDILRLELDDHFGKEERVLFPLTSALLSGTESRSLARRLRGPPVR